MPPTTPRPDGSTPTALADAGPQGGAGHRGTALVIGVLGYVGGQLVEPLLAAGWSVRTLTRSAHALGDAPWRDDVEIVEGDVTSADDLAGAMVGVDIVYFLLHAMDGHGDLPRLDRDLPRRFAAIAAVAGVSRIVYLGGIHAEGDLVGRRMSRADATRAFLASPVPAVCLRSAIILGDGSSSFEMLWHLTHRLPVMVAPKWLRNRIQPIAIRDVLHYLVAAADLPPDVNRSFDIGGSDVLTYVEMINRLARACGLSRRLVLTLPVLTPRLASYWIGLVTPVAPGLAGSLVGDLVREAVCSEDDIAAFLPDPPGGRLGYDDAIAAAMTDADQEPPARRNLAVAMTATSAAAFVNVLAVDRRTAWMDPLDMPTWRPPPASFPFLWTVVYVDIAATTAAAVTAFEDADEDEAAADFWRALAVNLTLNAGWSLLFFRRRRPWAVAAQLAALTVSSADLARRAGDAGPGYRTALLPYVGWCAYATALYSEIARRNPGYDGPPELPRGS